MFLIHPTGVELTHEQRDFSKFKIQLLLFDTKLLVNLKSNNDLEQKHLNQHCFSLFE